LSAIIFFTKLNRQHDLNIKPALMHDTVNIKLKTG